MRLTLRKETIPGTTGLCANPSKWNSTHANIIHASGAPGTATVGVVQIGWVLDHEHETTGALRLVLLAIADRANEHNECWPSKADIARRANVHPSKVRRWLRKLEEMGLIETFVNGAPDHRVRPDKRSNLYRMIGPPTGGPNRPPRKSTGGPAGSYGGAQRLVAGGPNGPPKPSMNHQNHDSSVSRMDYTKVRPMTEERFEELGVTFD